MAPAHPIQRLSRRARSGLKDLPSAASMMLAKALEPVEDAGESASGTVRDKLHETRVKVADVTPIGDSVDARMQRAREAAERAAAAEHDALEAAREAGERAERARAVAEQGEAHLTSVKQDCARVVERRTADARREADEMVARETARARDDADEHLANERAEVEDDVRRAEKEAQAAQEHAEARLASAQEQLEEARKLADEARAAAQEQAEEAQRHARALTAEADEQARRAEHRVEEAEAVRDEAAAATVAATANGDLSSQTKPELLELATSLDLEGRSQMTKAELVKAIRSATRHASA